MKRQTLILVAIGVILFLAGGGIAFSTVVNGSKNHSGSVTTVAVNTPVVVAKGNIPAGTTGQTMVAQGLVAIQTIPEKQYHTSDITTLQGLTDTVLTSKVGKGQAISSTELSASTSSVSLPKGEDGVSITMSGVNGLAGYLEPGSEVDVYANITKLSLGSGSGSSANIPTPCTELVMSKIEVLDVSSVVPTLSSNPAVAGGRTIPTSVTLLLATNPTQARVLTFMAQNESVSVTQTQNGAGAVPVGTCIGTGQTTVAP